MSAVETAVWNVEKKLEPGVSENELFAEMYHGVLMGGGEFIEARLLTSGPKTNPWFNEAGSRKVRPGELLALDTDTVGINGYSVMPNSPAGGIKRSGVGREGGWTTIEEYTEIKTVMLNMDA